MGAEEVILSPKNEQVRLGCTHPFQPFWVGSYIRLVIVKEIALDVSLADAGNGIRRSKDQDRII